MSGEMPDTVQITENKLKVLKVDESVNTTFVCEVTNRLGTRSDQVAVIVRGELNNRKTYEIIACAQTNTLPDVGQITFRIML